MEPLVVGISRQDPLELPMLVKWRRGKPDGKQRTVPEDGFPHLGHLVNLSRTKLAFGAGGGHPPGGAVAVQTCLCARVPTSCRQSWHLFSSISQEGTAAFLACVHCPPQMAETRSPLYLACQNCLMGPAAAGHGKPLMILLAAAKHGIIRSSGNGSEVPTTGVAGMSPGRM